MSTNRIPLAAYLLPALTAVWPAGAFAQRATTTVVTAAPNPAQIGQSVQLKAQVYYTASVTAPIFPTGTVTFTINGAAIPGCSAQLLTNGTVNGYANAVCATTFAQAGTLLISAAYSGDSGSAGSSGSADVTVMSATTITVAFKNGLAQVGQVLTLTAAVSNTGGFAVTGSVAFASNGAAIPGCSAAPIQLPGGTANCTTSFSQVGTFSIAAVYSGDTNNTPATGSMSLTIGKAYATPSIESYVQSMVLNHQYYASQAIEIDATFAQAPSISAPTGAVSFYDGSKLLAIVPLSGAGYAKAVLTSPSAGIPSLGLGAHSITATYGGDAFYQPSSTTDGGKPPVSLTIAQTATTPYITANPDGADASGNRSPLTYGQPVIFGAWFPPPPGSVIGPTGTVSFYDGSTLVKTVPVGADGRAELDVPSDSLAPLSVGTHLFKAVYSGDAVYQASDTTREPLPDRQRLNTDGLYPVTFDAAPVNLVMEAPRFQAGKPLTIFATPIVISPGIVSPGGAIDFTIGSAAVPGCTGLPVNNGQVQCSLTLQQPATVTARYGGDMHTATATATLALSAAQAVPGIYLETATTKPILGQSITVNVRLVGPPAFAAPTGTVTFRDTTGATPISVGAATLSADGHALLVIPSTSLPLGSHFISAAYDGDTNYLGATAPSLEIDVSPDPTTLVVAAPQAQLGQPLAMNIAVAAVSPGTAIPTGAVTILDGQSGSPIGSCTLLRQDAAGQCSLVTAPLSSLNFVATYGGDASASRSSIGCQGAACGPTPQRSFSRAKALSGIYLTADIPTPPVGTPVNIAALLVGAPGVPAPTGSVTFFDNGIVLASAPITAGRAVLTRTLAFGNHDVTAVYSGDQSYEPSPVAALVGIVVTKATTKLDLAPSWADGGQPVTLKASVSILGPDLPEQTGTVDFTNSGVSIAGCTGLPIQNGIALCTATFAQPGTYTIAAAYSGGPNIVAVSGSMQLTIGHMLYVAAYSTTLPYGAGVGIRALLVGTPTPTGTVTFSNGSSTLAKVPVGSDGTAPLSIPSGALPPLAVGTHAITAAYSGDGKYPAASAAPLKISITKAATSVAIYVAPPQINQPVLLKASVTVVSPGVAVPGGAVDFTTGGVPIAGCTGVALQNGAAFCNATFSQLANVAVTAAYGGDANTSPSVYSVPIAVGKAVASMYGASVPAAPAFGEPVVLRALLLGAAGVPAPTGSVTFSEAGVVLGNVPAGVDGRASLALAAGAVAAGQHVFTLSYAGDGNYAAATATLTVAISKASTSTALSAPFGAPFTATVSVLAPGAGSPGGTVQFFVGGVPAGSAPVSKTSGAFTASIPAGPWSGSAWAVYSGDANFAGSASASVAVAAEGTVSIASDHNPAAAGQPVAFTVVVTPASGGIVPTGRIQMSVDGVTIGNTVLVSGTATVPAGSALAAGSHKVAANYSGDSVYPAASATLVQLITKTAVSLTVAASPVSSVYGQPVTFTAQISASSGTVQFLDGSATIGSAPIQAGTATLTLANLAVGAHAILAEWTDDSGANAAASAPLSLSIAKAQTATVLRPSGLSLTAGVSAVAPGAGTPTGSVKFMDASNSSVFAVVPLSGGIALAAQPATADPLLAVYSGDPNFSGSTSAPLAPLAVTNAASFASDSFAPDEIVTLFGTNLATTTVISTSSPSVSLGGTTAGVTDSTGVRRAASLLFVSPSQVSVIVPPDTPDGPAVIAITNAASATFAAPLTVTSVAPGLFTADGSGKGLPVGQTVLVRADGTQDTPRDLAAGAIDLGNAGDAVYLVLYGTGIRHQSTAAAAFTCASCALGDQPVTYAGTQGMPGLDQVNVALPSTLRGAGQVTLTLKVDGASSNAVTLIFR